MQHIKAKKVGVLINDCLQSMSYADYGSSFHLSSDSLLNDLVRLSIERGTSLIQKDKVRSVQLYERSRNDNELFYVHSQMRYLSVEVGAARTLSRAVIPSVFFYVFIQACNTANSLAIGC